jgi:hypothetical protein
VPRLKGAAELMAQRCEFATTLSAVSIRKFERKSTQELQSYKAGRSQVAAESKG